jgi:site-specific recombinase XerD
VLLPRWLIRCGLRLSEALVLNLPDVDFNRRTIVVQQSKHGQTRLVPLPKMAKAAIQTYLSLRPTLLRGPDLVALFMNTRGIRWQQCAAGDVFRDLTQQGILGSRRIHAHLFRHSIAVRLLRCGADVRYIQEFLGRADLDTTKIYLRLVPTSKRTNDKAMPEIAVGLSQAPSM